MYIYIYTSHTLVAFRTLDIFNDTSIFWLTCVRLHVSCPFDARVNLASTTPKPLPPAVQLDILLLYSHAVCRFLVGFGAAASRIQGRARCCSGERPPHQLPTLQSQASGNRRTFRAFCPLIGGCPFQPNTGDVCACFLLGLGIGPRTSLQNPLADAWKRGRGIIYSSGPPKCPHQPEYFSPWLVIESMPVK